MKPAKPKREPKQRRRPAEELDDLDAEMPDPSLPPPHELPAQPPAVLRLANCTMFGGYRNAIDPSFSPSLTLAAQWGLFCLSPKLEQATLAAERTEHSVPDLLLPKPAAKPLVARKRFRPTWQHTAGSSLPVCRCIFSSAGSIYSYRNNA
jgi:hypothetical protein